MGCEGAGTLQGEYKVVLNGGEWNGKKVKGGNEAILVEEEKALK